MDITGSRKKEWGLTAVIYASFIVSVAVNSILQKENTQIILSNLVLSAVLAIVYSVYLHMTRERIGGMRPYQLMPSAFFVMAFFAALFLLGIGERFHVGVFWLLPVVLAAMGSGMELAFATHIVLMMEYLILVMPQGQQQIYSFISYLLLGIVASLLFAALKEKKTLVYLTVVLFACDGVLLFVIYQFDLSNVIKNGVSVGVELASIALLVVVGAILLWRQPLSDMGSGEEVSAEEALSKLLQVSEKLASRENGQPVSLNHEEAKWGERMVVVEVVNDQEDESGHTQEEKENLASVGEDEGREWIEREAAEPEQTVDLFGEETEAADSEDLAEIKTELEEETAGPEDLLEMEMELEEETAGPEDLAEMEMEPEEEPAQIINLFNTGEELEEETEEISEEELAEIEAELLEAEEIGEEELEEESKPAQIIDLFHKEDDLEEEQAQEAEEAQVQGQPGGLEETTEELEREEENPELEQPENLAGISAELEEEENVSELSQPEDMEETAEELEEEEGMPELSQPEYLIETTEELEEEKEMPEPSQPEDMEETTEELEEKEGMPEPSQPEDMEETTEELEEKEGMPELSQPEYLIETTEELEEEKEMPEPSQPEDMEEMAEELEEKEELPEPSQLGGLEETTEELEREEENPEPEQPENLAGTSAELEEEEMVSEPSQPESSLFEVLEKDFPLYELLEEYSDELFKHSSRISALSAAAAEVIGADVSLAKAGGLYHEIGRITNEEDYVKEGIALAEEYGFPQELVKVIGQHSITHELPESPEAAIVMLSDCIVSTGELLEKNGKRETITDAKLVNTVFKNRIAAGNLKNSGLAAGQLIALKDYYTNNFH